jgi:flagellar biosynthesis GTPase FlhF
MSSRYYNENVPETVDVNSTGKIETDSDFQLDCHRQQQMQHQHHQQLLQHQHQQNQQQQQRQEEDESMELARRLMAEEAMASYQHAMDMLRENAASQLSVEDMAALQAVLMEDEQEAAMEGGGDALWYDMDDDDDDELSYETLLMLGERMGDVKTERWTMESRKHVRKLPVEYFCPETLTASADDSERQCLVCQCEYTAGEKMRRLPCNHCFHKGCVDQWLKRKDACPYCRVSIVCK